MNRSSRILAHLVFKLFQYTRKHCMSNRNFEDCAYIKFKGYIKLA